MSRYFQDSVTNLVTEKWVPLLPTPSYHFWKMSPTGQSKQLRNSDILSCPPFSISSETLRRFAATYASRAGTPLEIVSKIILRHSNLATTQRHLGEISEIEAMRWIDRLHSWSKTGWRINRSTPFPSQECDPGYFLLNFLLNPARPSRPEASRSMVVSSDAFLPVQSDLERSFQWDGRFSGDRERLPEKRCESKP